MQFLQDFWPIILFFVAYKVGDIYAATITLMVGMSIQIAWQWHKNRTVNKMLVGSVKPLPSSLQRRVAAAFGG